MQNIYLTFLWLSNLSMYCMAQNYNMTAIYYYFGGFLSKKYATDKEICDK